MMQNEAGGGRGGGALPTNGPTAPMCSEGAEPPSPALEPLMECSTPGSWSKDGHTAAVC